MAVLQAGVEQGLTWQEIQVVNGERGNPTHPRFLRGVKGKVYLGPSQQVIVWKV